ncbi:MAG: hypothetical protein ABL858_00610 [Candidatus Nitrotoga sp.]
MSEKKLSPESIFGLTITVGALNNQPAVAPKAGNPLSSKLDVELTPL